jgi:hypothetical protein
MNLCPNLSLVPEGKYKLITDKASKSKRIFRLQNPYNAGSIKHIIRFDFRKIAVPLYPFFCRKPVMIKPANSKSNNGICSGVALIS